jgi:hypothetical protein
VAFIELLGQLPWVDAARTMPAKKAETNNTGMLSMNLIDNFVSWRNDRNGKQCPVSLQATARIFKHLKDTVTYDERLHHADVTLQQS